MKTRVGLNKKGTEHLKAELERLKPVDYNPDYFLAYKNWADSQLLEKEDFSLEVIVKDKNAWKGTMPVFIDFDENHFYYFQNDLDH